MGGIITPGQFTFAGGMLSRQMSGRADLQAYYNTVLKSYNFEVDEEGSLRFRNGTTYVATTQGNGVAYLVPFVFSALQAYVLEFSDLKMRVYKDRGLLTGGSLPVTTPWPSSVLSDLKYDQDVDVMTVCHGSYAPHDITRTGHTAWTCVKTPFIDGPFLPENATTTTFALSSTGLTTNITASAATFASTDVGRQVRFKDPAGNWHWYVITSFTSSTIVAAARGSATVAPSAGTATTSWRLGAFSDTTGWPVAVQFYENRRYYLKDQTLYGSKAASKTEDYYTFTEGTEADDPVTYVLPGGNAGRWLQEAQTFLGIGTFGSMRRASGGGNDEAITPTSISIKNVSVFGVASVQPVLYDRSIIYIARDGSTVLTQEYDALSEAYVSRNRTLTAKHVTRSGVSQMALQFAGKSQISMVLNNGDMAGLTFIPDQQVYGWFNSGTQGEVVSVCSVPQVSGGADELWMCVKRELNGVTTYCVEYRTDEIVFPDPEDYYTGPDNEEEDFDEYLGALYEAQKKAIHLDSSLTYDGRREYSLTLSNATVGTGRTVTASGSVFNSNDVGRFITGAPFGRAIITGYTSATVVTVEIITEFRSTTLPAQEWYLTARSLSGLTHLAGMTVRGIGDGQDLVDVVVDGSGNVTLQEHYSMIHLGLDYEGIVIGNVVEGGSQMGTSQTKTKNVTELAFRFLHTRGVWAGTTLYNKSDGRKGISKCELPKTGLKGGWAPPLYTGDFPLKIEDDWQKQKRWYINQRAPLPCTIQLVVPRFQTIDR